MALTLSLVVKAASLPCDPAMSCSPTVSLNTSSIDTVNATAFALMVSEMKPQKSLKVANCTVRIPSRSIRPDFRADSLRAVGANDFQNEEGISTENAEVLVRPNVDTLYSKAAIDLSHADVVLSLPEIPLDRYHVVPFYDL